MAKDETPPIKSFAFPFDAIFARAQQISTFLRKENPNKTEFFSKNLNLFRVNFNTFFNFLFKIEIEFIL